MVAFIQDYLFSAAPAPLVVVGVLALMLIGDLATSPSSR
jgi:hypothetical protein